MRASIHALTGAALALAIRRPEAAIPAAFASHFLLDLIPHYNPPGRIKQNFKNHEESYSLAFENKTFQYIFAIDMVLFVTVLILLPLITPAGLSPLTVFICAILGAAPDFQGGASFLLRKSGLLPHKNKDKDWFSRFHIACQLMERPWGIYVELVWLAFIVWVIAKLIR